MVKNQTVILVYKQEDPTEWEQDWNLNNKINFNEHNILNYKRVEQGQNNVKEGGNNRREHKLPGTPPRTVNPCYRPRGGGGPRVNQQVDPGDLERNPPGITPPEHPINPIKGVNHNKLLCPKMYTMKTIECQNA